MTNNVSMETLESSIRIVNSVQSTSKTLKQIQQYASEAMPPLDYHDIHNEIKRTEEARENFLKWHIECIKALDKLERQYKKILLERSKFYLGKSQAPFDERVLKSDLSLYIDADDEIQNARSEIIEMENLAKYCKEKYESAKYRDSNTIKNAVKWFELTNFSDIAIPRKK